MSAYVVFTRTKTIDQKDLEKYWTGIQATMKGHPIEVFVAYGKHEVLEGDPIEASSLRNSRTQKPQRIGITARPTKPSPTTADTGRSTTGS
jgi:hypothetical protein